MDRDATLLMAWAAQNSLVRLVYRQSLKEDVFLFHGSNIMYWMNRLNKQCVYLPMSMSNNKLVIDNNWEGWNSVV